jgi:hypothetical protein
MDGKIEGLVFSSFSVAQILTFEAVWGSYKSHVLADREAWDTRILLLMVKQDDEHWDYRTRADWRIAGVGFESAGLPSLRRLSPRANLPASH